MGRYVALLRGVNVGGHTVKMAELRRVLERMGLTDVSTFIASGNVIFASKARDEVALARRIEQELEGAFGFAVPTFLRSDAEVCALAAATHFVGAPGGGTEYVGFLAAPVPAARAKAVLALADGRNRFAVKGREVHWWTAGKMMESGLDYPVIEKAIAERATFRNITTVRRLAGMLG